MPFVDSLHIRDALDSDCERMSALCFASKAAWGYDATFMELCREPLRVTPAKLRAWTARVVEDGSSTLVGVYAFSVESEKRSEAELELMFVAPEAMRRGVGRLMADDLRSELRQSGVDTLWILSDVQAEPFYAKLGATRVGMRPSDAVPNRSLPWLRLCLG